MQSLSSMTGSGPFLSIFDAICSSRPRTISSGIDFDTRSLTILRYFRRKNAPVRKFAKIFGPTMNERAALKYVCGLNLLFPLVHSWSHFTGTFRDPFFRSFIIVACQCVEGILWAASTQSCHGERQSCLSTWILKIWIVLQNRVWRTYQRSVYTEKENGCSDLCSGKNNCHHEDPFHSTLRPERRHESNQCTWG